MRSEEEWIALGERLKLTPCPLCKEVGTLNRHGYLRGYEDGCSTRTKRAQRIFCSDRNQRHGCGQTFSVWLADKIRRLSVTTRCLWEFLKRAAEGTVAAAIRAMECQRSERTWQRLWKRFDLGQSDIRTALLRCCPPPELPAGSTRGEDATPLAIAAQTLAHLQAAFPDADCPIATFQHTLRTFFV